MATKDDYIRLLGSPVLAKDSYLMSGCSYYVWELGEQSYWNSCFYRLRVWFDLNTEEMKRISGEPRDGFENYLNSLDQDARKDFLFNLDMFQDTNV